MKTGSTRLGYKPEHAVDLDTGVIVAAPIHPADKGDATTLDPRLRRRRAIWPTSALRRRQTIHAIWSPTRDIIHAMA
jgi:hypothetical protein